MSSLTFIVLFIWRYIQGINYRTFLDLAVKLVVDYQDAVLIKRQYLPEKIVYGLMKAYLLNMILLHLPED